MPNQYQALAAHDPFEKEEKEHDTLLQSQIKQLHADPRFHHPAPSAWKRISLLLMIVLLFWVSYQLGSPRTQSKVIHADRYSKEFKYRPAASPIITEKLKDGVVRLRGAYSA